MRLIRLYIKDFIVFEEVDLSIEEKIYSVVGENRDQETQGSNGSGKSVLMQSIAWCLFDIQRDGLLKDEVIREGATFAQVVVEFEVDGKTIVVDRVRKHPKRGSNVTLLVDGEDRSKHHDSDTAAEIERQLGIREAVLFHCAYSDNPTVHPPFVSLTPALMIKTVSELISIERFDTFIKSVSELEKKLQLARAKCEGDFTKHFEKVAYIEGKMEELAASIDTFDEERKARLEVLESKIDKYAEEVVALEDKCAELAPLLEEYRKFDRAKLEAHEELKKEEAKLRKKLEDATTDASNLSSKMKVERKNISEVQSKYDNIINNKTGECTYCGNNLDTSDKLVKKAAQFEVELAKSNQKVIEIEAKELVAKSTLKKLNAALDECLADQEALAEEVKAYRELQSVVNEDNRYRSQIEVDNRFINDLVEQQIKVKEQKSSQLADSLKTLKQERKDVKALLADSEEEVVTVEDDIEAARILKEILKSCKIGVLNSFISKLLDQINHNLELITDGDISASLSVKRDSLVLDFSNDDEKYRAYKTFSRGEQVRISKAVQIALAQVTKVPLLVEDEGLSGLDPVGVSRIMDFMLGSGVENIFVVSHDPSVTDYLGDYPVLKVIKENGVSRVENG